MALRYIIWETGKSRLLREQQKGSYDVPAGPILISSAPTE